ncbi:hypothetical protein [Lysobacter sp. F6437]|uniref:hypothetical protein n=1 Tax=Lysobacter sp. F6437 TaxID=3459296 RepID=UPI00403D7F4A
MTLTEATLARIESKLDALIDALAGEDEEQDITTLDGDAAGGERDQTEGLG